MRYLELLAPARDKNIGIAAIDCGADAVYIAAPKFGARQAAGNSMEDIKELCDYAHRFGARIFVTLNTILYDDELEDAYRQMIQVQEAGADAIIVQDMAIMEMARHGTGDRHVGFHIPLHASTQCAIRTPEQAKLLESLGFSRLILERELSLEEIKAIRKAVDCELEFFVHGALCVCYSGQCYLSEHIAGRSANRGACIQACRSRYDLADSSGRILVKDKALLSLKDYNLKARLEALADSGICSFKIEGRLKNISYVRNTVRDYSLAMDEIISRNPDRYERSSFGSIAGGFIPDTSKTFNRGYTELFIDGKRGKWAAMDAAKSMGEEVGVVTKVSRDKSSLEVRLLRKDIVLGNGDGFSFVTKDSGVAGFRADICNGNRIRCKSVPALFEGARLFRNMNTTFEKELERQNCTREMRVHVSLDFNYDGTCWRGRVEATSEDGRVVRKTFDAGMQKADNTERMKGVMESQLGKTSGIYRFRLDRLDAPDGLPFMSAASLNGLRRDLASGLDEIPVIRKDMLRRDLTVIETEALLPENVTYKNNISNRLSRKVYSECGASLLEDAYELSHNHSAELMRSRYCIRYELGMCPKFHNAKDTGPLFLLNNGQRFALHFDCRRCEMILKQQTLAKS